MTVDEALEVIGQKLEEILEENEDAITWSTDCDIKNAIVQQCDLESFFPDEDELDNMYTYEIFDKVNNKVDNEKQIAMVKTWLDSLDKLAGISLDIDVSDIK